MNKLAVVACVVLGLGGCLGQCPPADTLGPCECHEDANGVPGLRCTRINGWSEVETVIENGLPHLSSFDVVSSPGLTDLPPFAFGDTTVDAIRFYGTGLIYLSKDVFGDATASALTSLYVKHNSEFNSLENNVASHLSGLESLYVSYNQLGSLEGALEPTTVTTIDLSHNGITKISPNYFGQCSELIVLLLPFNELTTAALGPDTLAITSDAIDFYVDLAGNKLEGGVDVAAFGGHPPKELVLSFNNITTMERSTFEPLMQAMVNEHGPEAYILLDHNDLGCGCGMSWLVDWAGLPILQQAGCSDGRLVSNLSEDDFAHC